MSDSRVETLEWRLSEREYGRIGVMGCVQHHGDMGCVRRPLTCILSPLPKNFFFPPSY